MVGLSLRSKTTLFNGHTLKSSGGARLSLCGAAAQPRLRQGAGRVDPGHDIPRTNQGLHSGLGDKLNLCTDSPRGYSKSIAMLNCFIALVCLNLKLN